MAKALGLTVIAEGVETRERHRRAEILRRNSRLPFQPEKLAGQLVAL